MFLTRLLKWILIVVLVLVVAVLIVVWPVLGVNPFEGRQDHLWSLTSNRVDFFVRFPGARVLEEGLAGRLETRPGFAWLREFKDELARSARELARETNPRIPGGVVEVEPIEDFAGEEMAIAGTIAGDYSRLRLSNFIAMTRVAPYAKFISALKRGFVRRRVDGLPDIEVEKGLYFKVIAPASVANALRPFRALKGRPGGDNTFYLARVKDVVLFSDEPYWIEDAILGGGETLPADAWFESEFRDTSRGGRHIELFARQSLTAHLMSHHGRSPRSPLYPVRALIPVRLLGEATLRVSPVGDDELHLSLTNRPPRMEEFGKVDLYVREIYEGEKGDPAFAFSGNGIGRFIPRERTLGSLVLFADPDELTQLAERLIPPQELDLIDDEVRTSSKGRYTTFQRLLMDLAEDLDDTHMIIVHRPSVFEDADFSTFKDPPGRDPTPAGQFAYTLVSKVKDTVAPDSVREKLSINLRYLRMKQVSRPHESGRFFLAEPREKMGDFELFKPAYGAMSGGRNFVVFSTSAEAAEAVYEAADREEARLVTDPGVQGVLARMPREATLALLVKGPVLHRGLLDHVREYAGFRMDITGHMRDFVQNYSGPSKEGPTDEEVLADKQRYVIEAYPQYKEQFENALLWLENVGAAGMACTLGADAPRRVKAKAWVTFRSPPPAESGEADTGSEGEE